MPKADSQGRHEVLTNPPRSTASTTRWLALGFRDCQACHVVRYLHAQPLGFLFLHANAMHVKYLYFVPQSHPCCRISACPMPNDLIQAPEIRYHPTESLSACNDKDISILGWHFRYAFNDSRPSWQWLSCFTSLGRPHSRCSKLMKSTWVHGLTDIPEHLGDLTASRTENSVDEITRQLQVHQYPRSRATSVW